MYAITTKGKRESREISEAKPVAASKKMTPEQLSASGKATMAEAKRIYAECGKSKRWQDCVAEASKNVNN